MSALRWPRSVRARLVATYTVIAVLLAAAGMALFVVLLHRGVIASVDATLTGRAAPLIAALEQPGTPQLGGPPPPAVAGGAAGQAVQPGAGPQQGARAVGSFGAVYRPDGTLALLQPAQPGYHPLDAAQVSAARSGTQHFTLGADQPLRVLTVPVRRADGTWVVAVGTALGEANEAAGTAIRDLELAVPVLIALAALGAWLLSGAALRPVESMRADAEEMGGDDPANRITVPATGDEVAKLARTFNALLDRLHRSLARQRNLIADAGHELRTPLAVLRTELELADSPSCSRDELADAVSHARREVERLSTMADNMLFLARADGAGPIVQVEPVDISPLLAATARAARVHAESLGIDIALAVPEHLAATVDPAALRRVFDNLIANALAVTPHGGTVTLSARRPPGGLVVSVSDTGPGFPPDFLQHAFARFSRPHDANASSPGGAGLGLAIVAEIVHAHNGTVTAANNAEGGATVAITLPPTTPDATCQTAAPHQPRRPQQ